MALRRYLPSGEIAVATYFPVLVIWVMVKLRKGIPDRRCRAKYTPTPDPHNSRRVAIVVMERLHRTGFAGEVIASERAVLVARGAEGVGPTATRASSG